jgi:hypothetical protein
MELSEQSYDIAPTVARNPLPEGLLSYALSSETRYGYAFELTKQFCGCLCRLGPGENLAGDPGTERGMLKRLELAIFSVHYRFIGCVGEPPHFLARFGIGKQCLVG